MQVDGIFDNRQPKTGARNLPYIAGPVKRLKEMRDFVRGYANTLVCHFKKRMGVLGRHAEVDRPSFW